MSSTTQLIEGFLNSRVLVSTIDGRVLLGNLMGFDPQCNLILAKFTERVFSANEGVELHEHGLFILRGDNVATIGQVDTNLEAELVWENIRADSLKPIRF